MDYTTKSQKELKDICKQLKITGYSNKNKEDLIKLLQPCVNSNTTSETQPIEPLEPLETLQPSQTIEPSSGSPVTINSNVSYFNTDILKFTTANKFDLIYLDPPYETNRTFSVNSLDDDTGFDDVWEEDKYVEWLDKLVVHLSPMLTSNGTLVFHISSENSFIAESILKKYTGNGVTERIL